MCIRGLPNAPVQRRWPLAVKAEFYALYYFEILQIDAPKLSIYLINSTSLWKEMFSVDQLCRNVGFGDICCLNCSIVQEWCHPIGFRQGVWYSSSSTHCCQAPSLYMESGTRPYRRSRAFHQVVLDGKSSSPALVTSDVPQGTVLSPFLFLACINDVP